MSEAVLVVNKPKLTGISFNIFALVGLLVILPIGTAFVSNLANTNSEDYISIPTEFNQELSTDQEVCQNPNYDEYLTLRWLDKGLNMTTYYEYIEQTNDPYIYETIWDESSPFYQWMSSGCPQNYVQRNDKLFLNGFDNHHYLPIEANQGNIPNYHGYIGYSGEDFTFLMNNNLFKYMDDNKDISSIKMTFIDQTTGFDCDNEVFNDINFKGDIKLMDNNFNKTYSNFKFSQKNSYFVNYDPTINPTSFCHISITAEFDFTPIESIELNGIFTDYDNLSAQIRLYDFDLENYTGLAPVGQFSPQIPFTGDGFFAYDLEVAYVDNIKTNFFLSGGTFILGGALWLLAISSTPYWNPVVNRLGGKK